MALHSILELVHVPGARLLNQLPANGLKAGKDGPSSQVGEPEEVPGFISAQLKPFEE